MNCKTLPFSEMFRSYLRLSKMAKIVTKFSCVFMILSKIAPFSWFSDLNRWNIYYYFIYLDQERYGEKCDFGQSHKTQLHFITILRFKIVLLHSKGLCTSAERKGRIQFVEWATTHWLITSHARDVQITLGGFHEKPTKPIILCLVLHILHIFRPT